MAKLTKTDKKHVARWVSAHPAAARRLERGVLKFVAKMERRRRARRTKVSHRRTR